MSQQLFSSESVTEGHPDKVCDRISDAILDALLEADPRSRVAVETMAATGLIHVAGEVTTEAYVEIPEIVRREILSIGYDSSRVGFDGASCGVSISLDGQSPDIAGGVDEALEVRGTQGGDPRDRLGAGDQGIMFGYAASDTPDLMPAPIWLAHRLAKRLTDVRKQGIVEGLRPDGKTQVTLAYENGRPVGIDTIVVSTQHDENLTQSAIADAVRAHVIDPVIEESGLELATGDMTALINPSGRFVLGGPAADVGLTGRKIIVDTYGGRGAHGGGAFSGKDPSKVDRSAAYAARHIAKNLVAAGVADEILVQLSYAIGVAEPISIYVNTYGKRHVALTDGEIAEKVRTLFDLRPYAIEERLKLRTPIYTETANHGHMGHQPRFKTKTFKCKGQPDKQIEVELFTWEKLDYVDKIKAAFGL